MKKLLAVLALGVLGFAGPALALNWIGYGYVIYDISSPGGQDGYYDIDQATANPNFVGSTVTVDSGGSILLGGEVRTNDGNMWNNPWGADFARIYYRINGGSFTLLNLPWYANTDGPNQGDKDVWAANDAGEQVNLYSLLSVGLNTIDVYFYARDNNGGADQYLSNDGGNYRGFILLSSSTSATTSAGGAAPEPGTLSLSVLAGVIMLGLRRKLMKK